MKTPTQDYSAFCLPALGEEPVQFERLLHGTMVELRPSNLIEQDVAMEVVHNRWRLQRCARLRQRLVSAEQTGEWDGPEARDVTRQVGLYEGRLRRAHRRSLATFAAIRRTARALDTRIQRATVEPRP